MIDYDPGRYAMGFIWRCSGSVFPRALVWAFPTAILAFAIGRLRHDGVIDFDLLTSVDNMATLWASFQYVLGFLCVFRTQQAYGRYMEGALLLRLMRTEWVNAFSSIVSYSSRDASRRSDIEQFQHYLMRLMSLLACYTLQSMSDSVSEEMPVISLAGMDAGGMLFLQSKQSYTQRSEIVKQWIQRLVIEQYQNGNLAVEAPILATFFQAFDKGASYGSQARNLTDIPFPFAYAQVMTVMLVIHAVLTPLIAGLTMNSAIWGSAFTFISVLSFWGTNYIACEIESPFGDDANDLPLINIQHDINASFWIQLERQTQQIPIFQFDKSVHRRWSVQVISHPVADMVNSKSSVESSASSLKSSRLSKRSLFDSASPMHWVRPRLSKLTDHGSNLELENHLLSLRSSRVSKRASYTSENTDTQMNDLGEPIETENDDVSYPSESRGNPSESRGNDTGSKYDDDEPKLLSDAEESCEGVIEVEINTLALPSPNYSTTPSVQERSIDRPWNAPIALVTTRATTSSPETPRLKICPATPIGISRDGSTLR